MATRGPLWGYLKSQFFRDLVNFWRYMPTKWLQERAKGSKNEHGMPPHRAFCGEHLTPSEKTSTEEGESFSDTKTAVMECTRTEAIAERKPDRSFSFGPVPSWPTYPAGIKPAILMSASAGGPASPGSNPGLGIPWEVGGRPC